MTDRRERADTTLILVWNGLVTTMRRTGAESRKTRLAGAPPVHSCDDVRQIPPGSWKDPYECLTAADREEPSARMS